MVHSIRAVYQNGQLRLLDPVELSEGQEVELVILSEQEKLHSALGDLLVQIDSDSIEDIDEQSLLAEIAEDFRGQPPLSQSIIEERNKGP